MVWLRWGRPTSVVLGRVACPSLANQNLPRDFLARALREGTDFRPVVKLEECESGPFCVHLLATGHALV